MKLGALTCAYIRPSDTTASCNGPVDPDVTGQATATDDCDPKPEVTYSDEQAAGCEPA